MDCEVAVVGGGIGGLTVAALLAQRGVDVCVLERDSQAGGCVAPLEKFGYRFEPTDGLYTGWAAGDIHSRIFSELPVSPPETRLLKPSYTVALPDRNEVSISGNLDELEIGLSLAFPECSEQAISFYKKLAEVSSSLTRVFDNDSNFFAASAAGRVWSIAKHGSSARQLRKYVEDTVDKHLVDVSTRFRRFIDVQLQTLAQGDVSQVSFLYAASVLADRRGMFAINGGAAALAERLAESIQKSGGRVKLNSPVLRLSYDSAGKATGVDLLTGESVKASHAIISNPTVWDTYGKLIGLNNTPPEVRKHLKDARGWGAYLVFAGIDDAAAKALPECPVLHLLDWPGGHEYDPENLQLTFNAAPSWDPRGPAGKRAVTIHSVTDVDRWFTFHQDETELEEMDQEMLTLVWDRLHKSVPSLGGSIEVIETSTPRSYYEQTRRKLGMVRGLPVTPSAFAGGPSFETYIPKVFIVSDTSSYGGIAGVSQLALMLANHLTGK